MLYPQNAIIANGSRRTTPTWPTIAAVVSLPRVAAMYTPSRQLFASVTSGTVVERRPPKMNASIGTPAGSSHCGSIDGHCEAATVKRALGCAAGRPDCGVHSLPCQSVSFGGGSFVIPSHHTSPSGVRATFVKMVFFFTVSMQFGLVSQPVPGATPKKPASGLIARSVPSFEGLIHAMSSPMVVTFQPWNAGGGISIAKLVLPQALGNAAVT